MQLRFRIAPLFEKGQHLLSFFRKVDIIRTSPSETQKLAVWYCLFAMTWVERSVVQIVVCVSLLVVYGRLYSVVGDCQLNVEERQFKFTDGKSELESWREIADVINELLQLGASALCGSNYVIDVALV